MMKTIRKGLGRGMGTGYKNLIPVDSHVHSLSAKGIKSKCPLKALSLQARGSLKSFDMHDGYTIVAYSEGTRNGFRHMASLLQNGHEVATAKATYLNRTWEAYEFQSVIYKLLNTHFPKDEAKTRMEVIDGRKAGSTWAKGQKDLMKKVFEFDHLNPDYGNEQLQGLIKEIKKPEQYQDDGYIAEKIDNTKRHYDMTLDSLKRRITNKELREEFLQTVKGKK